MNPRVSVVVPAYNNAEYLAATLDSVLAQEFTDYELVVADHSSSDATAEILGRYASHPKVRVLPPTPTGGGALANWNRVSRHARRYNLRRIRRESRRTLLSESPSLAVSALSKARTPKSMIRFSPIRLQPTEAIPMSRPSV